jgi:hypothetical protein
MAKLSSRAIQSEYGISPKASTGVGAGFGVFSLCRSVGADREENDEGDKEFDSSSHSCVMKFGGERFRQAENLLPA